MNAHSAATYLESYLSPLASTLGRADVTDLFVNRPGEIWVETIGGGLEKHAAPDINETMLWRLARQVASFTNQGINREHPILSANLPNGERVQIVAPPATRGQLAIAIRKHGLADLKLVDYVTGGAFSDFRPGSVTPAGALNKQLSLLLRERKAVDFLQLAVRGRKNIVISGGTSSGKTTFLNALLKEVPLQERLILIEDTPEIRVHHPNSVCLIAVRGESTLR